MVHESTKLLLVGRTGNGKSSTGNSIIGEQIFPIYGAGESEEEISPKDYSNGSTTVVDGTGIGDTGEDSTGGTSDVLASMNKAFMLCDSFITAVVIVLKYGVRFTKQERDAVQRIKSLLGDSIFRKHGIIVMTYGDNFRPSGENTTFESWCETQSGDFQQLLTECNFRCVLFNNRTKEKKVQDDQRKLLFKYIGQLRTQYTRDDYRKAAVPRGDIDATLKEFKQKFAQISENVRCEKYKRIREYTDALNVLRDHLAYLKRLDSNTQLMQDSIDGIKHLMDTVELQMGQFSLPPARPMWYDF